MPMKVIDAKEVDELARLTGLPYYEERIVLLDDIRKIDLDAMKTEAYICVLCLKGRGSVNLNNHTYHVEENDFLFCRPNVLVDGGMFSPDFEKRGIVLTSLFAKEFEMQIKDGWNFAHNMEFEPVNKFDTEERELLINYWDLINRKITEGNRGAHYREVINSIMAAFAYEISDSTERFRIRTGTRYGSAEKLYSRFMELLTASFPKPLDVNHYASRVCVTPKYLSAACKKTCGKTASEIIYNHILNDAKFYLRQNDLTIKEVAIKLGFSNLSFFGKYTKRGLGMSPKAYRYKLCGQESL